MISRAAAFRLASSLLLASLIGQLGFGLDFFQSANKPFFGGIAGPFHFEYTYTVAINTIGSGETIDFGDILEIQAGPEPASNFSGFEFRMSDGPFPPEWTEDSGSGSGFPPCRTDPNVQFCVTDVFYAPNTVPPGPGYGNETSFLCASDRDPLPGDPVMPNGRQCASYGPNDLIQSHFFMYAALAGGSSALPLTGTKQVGYIRIITHAKDWVLPLPTAVLYDQNGHVKYISGISCLFNGRAMMASFCGLTPP